MSIGVAREPADVRVSAPRLVLWSLPDLIPPALAGFSVVAMVFLLIGQYRPALVLPLGLAAAGVAVIVCRPTARTVGLPTRLDLRPLGVIGLLCIASAAVNVAYAAQYIYDWRDPATYGISGRWLVDNPSVLIPNESAMFGNVTGLGNGSLGFGVLNDQSAAYPQGNHLLPALLAVPGWIFGPSTILRTNAVIGALSLLALYALARRMLGEWWGIVPPAALAASMPFLAFVRATYSEPIALLFLVAGMALVIRAIETTRVTDMAVAGLTLGCSALARVDSYVALIAVPVAAAALCLTAVPAERRRRLAAAVALVVGSVAPVVVGVLDLVRLSPGYWVAREHEVRLLGVGGVVLGLLGAAVVAVVWAKPERRLAPGGRRTVAYAAGAAVVVGFAVLASRPLWFTAHYADPAMASTLTTLQSGQGLTVDPTRSYDELSLSWVSWYYGWPTVALGAIGLGLLTFAMIKRAEVRLVLPLAVTLGLSALYFNRVMIYPDQVWAMRRFLPVVLPGLLIAAAYVLARMAERGRPAQVLAGALTLVALAFPTVVSFSLVVVVDGRGQSAEVAAVCDALPENAAVLTVNGGDGIGSGYLQTFRAFCEVPATGIVNPTPATLAAAAAASEAAGRALYVVTGSVDAVTWDGLPQRIENVYLVKWPERLLDAPSKPIQFQRDIYIGLVAADGIVTPVEPAP